MLHQAILKYSRARCSHYQIYLFSYRFNTPTSPAVSRIGWGAIKCRGNFLGIAEERENIRNGNGQDAHSTKLLKSSRIYATP
ncbi:MAG: hypothetical protein F6K17_38790, partial [Okeania sp. SIO3C4]|nr:hypothetical protein [Okeania sp. SIO3C4]